MKKKQGGSAGLIVGIMLAIGIATTVAVTQDWKTGHNSLVDYVQARFGGPEAQYAMGQKLYLDKSRKDAAIKAQPWFERAAAEGNVAAMVALADIFSGNDDQASGDQAVFWYKKAATVGNAEAIRKLGISYEIGRGQLKADAEKAFDLYGRAAQKGDIEAEYLYGAKLSLRARYDEAILWLNKAAASGSSDADVELGKLYSDGWEPESPQKAFEHFKRAADAGSLKPQLTLSYMYLNGIGTEKDVAEAYKCVLLANDVANVGSSAKLTLRMFEKNLTPEDKAEGQKRAKAWRVAHKH